MMSPIGRGPPFSNGIIRTTNRSTFIMQTTDPSQTSYNSSDYPANRGFIDGPCLAAGN